MAKNRQVNDSFVIGGIQQIGIGVDALAPAMQWYGRYFGCNTLVFHDEDVAELMIPYTGGEVHLRSAVLMINMAGGGGLEIWQYSSRNSARSIEMPKLGDLGIFASVIRSPNVLSCYDAYYASELYVHDEPKENPAGDKHFYMADKYGNIFDIQKGSSWFSEPKYYPPQENEVGRTKTGGVTGAVIGVSDIEASLPLYRDILGYTTLVYDKTGNFEDTRPLSGGRSEFRRVMLKNKASGPFRHLLCDSTIELVQVLDRVPNRIFEGRFWGDMGFIHVCFDVCNMDALKEHCASLGYPFVVDSEAVFFMSEAAGRFAYIEDRDGTLIEFVETYKLPLTKRMSYMLTAKRQRKALPRLLLRGMKLRSLAWKNNQLVLPETIRDAR